MQNEIQAISYMLKQDPAAVAGFLLIGSSGVLYIHVQLKMVRAGYKTSFDVLRAAEFKRAGNARSVSQASHQTRLVAVACLFVLAVPACWNWSVGIWIISPPVLAD